MLCFSGRDRLWLDGGRPAVGNSRVFSIRGRLMPSRGPDSLGNFSAVNRWPSGVRLRHIRGPAQSRFTFTFLFLSSLRVSFPHTCIQGSFIFVHLYQEEHSIEQHIKHLIHHNYHHQIHNSYSQQHLVINNSSCYFE